MLNSNANKLTINIIAVNINKYIILGLTVLNSTLKKTKIGEIISFSIIDNNLLLLITCEPSIIEIFQNIINNHKLIIITIIVLKKTNSGFFINIKKDFNRLIIFIIDYGNYNVLKKILFKDKK